MGLQEESAGYRTKGAYSIRTVVILLILAFACGLAAMGWATSRWHGWWDRKQVVVQEQRPGAQDMINNDAGVKGRAVRSEEHTSELQSLMRSSYAVFCLK